MHAAWGAGPTLATLAWASARSCCVEDASLREDGAILGRAGPRPRSGPSRDRKETAWFQEPPTPTLHPRNHDPHRRQIATDKALYIQTELDKTFMPAYVVSATVQQAPYYYPPQPPDLWQQYPNHWYLEHEAFDRLSKNLIALTRVRAESNRGNIAAERGRARGASSRPCGRGSCLALTCRPTLLPCWRPYPRPARCAR